MSNYASVQDVKDFGSMPAEDIDTLESTYPGLTLKLSEAISAIFDARLSKRYSVPFSEPYPNAIVLNVSRVTAWRLWLKRGYNPSGETDQALRQDYEDAEEWLKEAANSVSGLIELPAKQSDTTDGVAKTSPIFYSETSPYKWADLQRDRGCTEDGSG